MENKFRNKSLIHTNLVLFIFNYKKNHKTVVFNFFIRLDYNVPTLLSLMLYFLITSSYDIL
ncbi:hypothetical protein SAMN05421679_103243 [Epilithonimonas pallida]|uniref:Uncharacterized protein n=1 Tax=Epilithonimonas pallida TaxID=373671 RepID=A0ABY1R266_9FLAO|nr:hypothetical protein SAMN05421679_103243 [Epilithonimonas pallida]